MKDFIVYLSPSIFLAPFFSVLILSAIGFLKLDKNELLVKRVVMIAQIICLLESILVFYLLNITKTEKIIPIINWQLFNFGEHSVLFKLSIDRLSSFFVLMSAILTNIVGVFSQNYLHRDSGFYRFFFLNNVFLIGIIILFSAANFQVIFIGWELIGITSALLISFFHLRKEAIDNALYAFWAYRISDIGLLSASAILGAALSHSSFGHGISVLPKGLELIVPLLILLSAMGKSAQYPFSAWLPRAMEGPTSSSAIFYGGLSVHAGVYLLLRLTTEFEVHPIARIVIVSVGFISAIYGSLLSQVQSDIKSSLAYASLSQVGIMFIEIGFGFNQIAILHCLGHAILRTYQILKSASVIHEYIDYEDAHINHKVSKVSSIVRLFIGKKFIEKLFSYSFDLALRDSSSPNRLMLFLEKTSTALESLEDSWTKFLTTGLKSESKEK